MAAFAAIVLLVPAVADARAGGGTNNGSRGTKTNQAPPPTQTAPTAKPIERSTTPNQQQAQAAPRPAAPAAQPGFFQRHPFLSGLMGGLVGAGLIGMLMGGGFGGMAGILSLLIQAALIGGLVFLVLRLVRGRSAMPGEMRPAYAGPTPHQAAAPMARSTPTMLAGSTAGLAIAKEDFEAFEAILGDVQGAYSRGDLGRLRTLATPEMLGYFSEQLSTNASRGLENKVEAVKLEQGDLSEAWREGDIDYATVAMRFSMTDVTRRLTDGAVVEGNPTARSEATEIWTFLRSRGGNWILSAIQQA
ncbi:MAG: TIM44-like domain-containing protein [Reyranella sp.]|nr:TIM44-like domain-containing protein [Reyranella sp.]